MTMIKWIKFLLILPAHALHAIESDINMYLEQKDYLLPLTVEHLIATPEKDLVQLSHIEQQPLPNTRNHIPKTAIAQDSINRHATMRRGIFLKKYRYHTCFYLKTSYRTPSRAKAGYFNTADRTLLEQLHALDKETQSEIVEKIRADYLDDYRQYIIAQREAPKPEKLLLASFNGFLTRYNIIEPSEPL
jgi:hypothetical protein